MSTKSPSSLYIASMGLFLYATLLLFILSPTFPVDAQSQTPLFIFGDSLYDSGMTLYNGVKGAGAEFPPYGETYFKKPAGRYSDGRLIPDFIAQFANVPFVPPYLQPGLTNFKNGVNFASAGACVLVDARPATINIKKQLNYFGKMIRKLKNQVGAAEANRVVSKGVYMFNIGGNDYVTLIQKNLKRLPLSPSVKRHYMNMVLGNLTTDIRTMYSMGARKFSFQNIGPIGCMPSMKYMANYKGTCMREPQELARLHNAGFLAVAKKLQAELPGFKYSVYDFYSACEVRVYYGKRYGFPESQTACCGSGSYNGEFTCQKKDTGFSLCSNPIDHLWFDAAHPTDKANQQFALQFWSGGPNIAGPYNLKALFSMD